MDGITPIVNTQSGCDYHRVTLPLRYMGVDINDYRNKDVEEILSKTKVLIFNRNPTIGIEPFLPFKKKYGFKIVCDVDDYWELYPQHILYKSWQQNQMHRIIPRNISFADCVFTTTSILADKVKLLNKNVHVIPNGLPFDDGQFNSERAESDNFRVLYAGGSSHARDLQTIQYAINKLVHHKVDCQFILAGHNTGDVWNKMERVLSANGKANYIRRTTLELESYMNHYRYADVSLAPLEDNYFNRFKSNLKIIEAGCKYIPCVASNMSPYCDDILLSKRAFLVNNTNEWYRTIKELSLNPNQVQDMGQELGEFVREKYNLFKINTLRKQIFEFLSK